MFDKYICRIIKKPEPTLEDLANYLGKVLLYSFFVIYNILVVTYLICFNIIGFIIFDNHEDSIFVNVWCAFILAVELLAYISFLWNKIKDKKIAKCPTKK
jgi:hypothetical protein